MAALSPLDIHPDCYRDSLFSGQMGCVRSLGCHRHLTCCYGLAWKTDWEAAGTVACSDR